MVFLIMVKLYGLLHDDVVDFLRLNVRSLRYNCVELNYSSQLFLAIKFKVLSRFYPGQKGHSSGFSTDSFCTKRQIPKAF